jgi:hypothetical protein
MEPRQVERAGMMQVSGKVVYQKVHASGAAEAPYFEFRGLALPSVVAKKFCNKKILP